MDGVTKKKHGPKYQQVVDALRRDIAMQVYLPGERLPSENELVERFDVSLITARRAYSELTAAGEVYRIKGKGSFVALMRPQGEAPAAGARLVSFVMMDYHEADESILEIILGAQKALSRANYQMTILSSKSADSEQAVLERCLSGGISGVLIFSTNPDDSVDTARRLTQNRIPVVFIDRSPTRQPCSAVATNNYDGGYRLAEHLTDLGHRRILFAGDRSHINTEIERHKGYRDCLNNLGLYDPDLSIFNAYQNDDRLKDHLINRRASAVCCVNDRLAIWLMDRLQEMGLKVPHDIAITGFDDLALARRYGLTTMRQDFSRMGSQAADMVLEWLHRPDRQGNLAVSLPAELLVRESSGLKRA